MSLILRRSRLPISFSLARFTARRRTLSMKERALEITDQIGCRGARHGRIGLGAPFDGIAAGLKADPTIAKKANGVFQFNLSKPASEWVVDCKAATVKPGKAAKADVTLTLSDADFVAMAAGKLNGMQAFMSGKMKIKGNMALAQKFGALVDQKKSKL